MDIEQVLEKVSNSDDLSVLTDEERWVYYKHMCEKFGLDPTTKPFSYITFEDGKTRLYALRNATDQLRKNHNISIEIVRQGTIGDSVYAITARAKTEDGRVDEAVGAVALKDDYGNYLSPKQLSNAIMSCQTKAIRRVTLSICGVSVLDETEVNEILNTQPTKPNTKKENKQQSKNNKNGSKNGNDIIIEGQGKVLSIKKQRGKNDECYHSLVVSVDGKQHELFAVNKVSELVKERQITNGMNISFKGKKHKKGLLLVEFDAAS